MSALQLSTLGDHLCAGGGERTLGRIRLAIDDGTAKRALQCRTREFGGPQAEQGEFQRFGGGGFRVIAVMSVAFVCMLKISR